MKFGKKEAFGLGVLGVLGANVEGQNKITPGSNQDHFPTTVVTTAEDPHNKEISNKDTLSSEEFLKQQNFEINESFNKLKEQLSGLRIEVVKEVDKRVKEEKQEIKDKEEGKKEVVEVKKGAASTVTMNPGNVKFEDLQAYLKQKAQSRFNSTEGGSTGDKS